MRFHFDVGRKASIEAVKAAMNDSQRIFLVTQRDVLVDEPLKDDLYNMGVVASIKQVIKNPNEPEHLRVVVEVLFRAQIVDVLQESPYFLCDVREKKTLPVKEEMIDYKDALVNKVKDELFFFLSQTVNKGEDGSFEADKMFFTENHDEFADMVSGHVLSDYKEKQQLLEKLDLIARLELLYELITKENKILEIEGSIEERTQKQMEENQRDYYLREKMKAISTELGDGEDVLSETQKYKQKIAQLPISVEIKEKLLSECNKLQKMQGSSADSAVIRNYLDTALSLPFGVYTEDRLDVARAEKILDDDHYGLKKVKERFVEMLAVKQRSENLTGQIICLVGPPGVGKTSIVRSVAKAMGRKYVRMSLGGVSDESEIRGHRKTYIGAMPGRVANAVIQAKTFNPVILLDEIDKLGRDYKGDPSAALLEVLDPEQNSTFRDNYLEFPVDLSKVLFITTANDASAIPGPLYDRMEIIELVSYTQAEKHSIAKNHLIKKQVKLHGLSGNNIRFTDEAIDRLIDGYSKEAGVRRLEQLIASVCRKSVVEIAKTDAKRIIITPEIIEKMLGPVRYKREEILKENTVGVVNGLAWTSVGGEMLQVEAITMEGDGKIEITGSLGDVMKESAKAAYSFIRSKKDNYGISIDEFTKKNIHIHVPQGAVPKDGPSAGVTIATALLSALSGNAVKNDVAMTGEVTLTGRVLPIGGLKEKSMAAYKSGVKKVLIPKDNYSDLWEIDSVVKENVEFIPVSSLDEVFSHAIVNCQKDEQSSVIFTHRDINIKDRRKKSEI
ncbi:MAG: endopeptidase La, partial [Acutalibacteraceae bacterium]